MFEPFSEYLTFPRHHTARKAFQVYSAALPQGMSVNAALGYLFLTWDTVAEHGKYGDLMDVSGAEFARAVGWRHYDPMILMKALVRGQYIEMSLVGEQVVPVPNAATLDADTHVWVTALDWEWLYGRLEKRRAARHKALQEVPPFAKAAERILRRRDQYIRIPRRITQAFEFNRFRDCLNRGRPKNRALTVADCVGVLIRFWDAVAESGIDGTISVTPQNLTKWAGLGRNDGGVLIEALAAGGFARDHKGTVMVESWEYIFGMSDTREAAA